MADVKNELARYDAQDEKKIDTTGRKVRIGIIGTGWIAGSHIKQYLEMPDVEVVALADLVPGKAKAFAESYGLTDAHCYLSDEELIKGEPDIDGVSICTYNMQHAPCAIHCLDAGINVMLEKPFTVTLDEAIEVMRAEKRSGKILTIGFQPRMSENMKMIKKIVDSGELGKIYYLQAGGGRRHGIPTPYGTSFIAKETGGVGAVGDIGSYSLDMLLKAVGYPKPLTVSGYTSAYFGTNPDYYPTHPEYAKAFGVDDFSAAFIRLEGDIILDFRISWAMNMDTCGDALILGTEGGLRIPSTECWNGEFSRPLTVYKHAGGLSGQPIQYEVPMKPSGNLFYDKLRSFVDAIKTGGEATVPSSEIIYNQAIIDAIVKSAEQGKEVTVEIPEI